MVCGVWCVVCGVWYLDKPSVDVDQLNSAISLDIVRHQLVHSLIPGSQWTVGTAARKESLERFILFSFLKLFPGSSPEEQGMLEAVCS